jgi:intracellular sulfur oxidation DsrE/DsrF family protein
VLEALAEAGVDLYVCGQAARWFDVPRDKIAAPVKVALSAMSAVVLFQSQGYEVLAY